jgi:hypothetical protein
VVDGLEVHEHAVVEDTIEVEHQDVRDGYGGVRLAALAASDRRPTGVMAGQLLAVCLIPAVIFYLTPACDR